MKIIVLNLIKKMREASDMKAYAGIETKINLKGRLRQIVFCFWELVLQGDLENKKVWSASIPCIS